jgi:HEAT repeat protein
VNRDDIVSILMARLEEEVNRPSLWRNEFSALAPLARTHAVVRSALVNYITKHKSRAMNSDLLWRNEEGFVLDALIYLTANDHGLRKLMEEMLSDPTPNVRAVSALALFPLLQTDGTLARRFRPWLGAVGSEGFEDTASFVRRRLADSYAPLLEHDATLRDWLCEGLDSPSRHMRQGAAWTLIAVPGGPSRDLLPKLRGLLEDRRSLDGADERLQIARGLLNCRDHSLAERAITTVQDILRYRREEWHIDSGIQESRRSQAAQALGSLMPLDPSPELSKQFLALLEDTDPSVRSAAYQGLLRLLVTDAGATRPT